MQGGRALIDGGHYTLRRIEAGGEPITAPDGSTWAAATSETTRASLRAAVIEVLARRGTADLAVMVGDLAMPAGSRPPGGLWAIPPSYRDILAELGLERDGVRVLGEAFCRNQGKRRLLDELRDRDPERTYAAQGFALLADRVGLRLASDASLDWDAEVKVVALTRGSTPLCPLVFAGLKRWAFRNGYAEHVAFYALADDPYIDAKLRAGATAAAQLLGGAVGEQVHRLLWASQWVEERLSPGQLVAPGEFPWEQFYARARGAHPGLCRIEEARWQEKVSGSCTPSEGASSPCSG